MYESSGWIFRRQLSTDLKCSIYERLKLVPNLTLQNMWTVGYFQSAAYNNKRKEYLSVVGASAAAASCEIWLEKAKLLCRVPAACGA